MTYLNDNVSVTIMSGKIICTFFLKEELAYITYKTKSAKLQMQIVQCFVLLSFWIMLFLQVCSMSWKFADLAQYPKDIQTVIVQDKFLSTWSPR